MIRLILALLFLTSPCYADGWVNNPVVYSYTHITTDTTTNVKSSAGFLHTVTINKPVASSVIAIEDNYAGITGPTIASITLPATLLQEGPYTAVYDVNFVNGMTVYTTVGASDISISSQ